MKKRSGSIRAFAFTLCLLLFGFGFFWSLPCEAHWIKTYGGSEPDFHSSLQQTADGGYIVAGGTRSFGEGNEDIWVLKLDSDGNITWQKAYGGSATDYAYSVQQTSDGG